MKFLRLFVWIAICELAGIIGSIFTVSQISFWYAGLVKPALNPPSWIFGPVWTLLYLLMGVAAWLVWEKGWKKREVPIALSAFFCQLLLNILWSMLFFGLHSPALGLACIVLLWLAIAATIYEFRKVSAAAAWLLVPYILWVTFASYLNYSIWVFNK